MLNNILLLYIIRTIKLNQNLLPLDFSNMLPRPFGQFSTPKPETTKGMFGEN